MDRRESIKSLLLGSVAGGLLLNSCDDPAEKVTEKIWEYQYGRSKKEAAIDKVLLETTFFTPTEEELITCLANLILPPNEQGNIEKAGVVPFIGFMMVDYPDFQLPMRGGLMALNTKANKNFGLDFIRAEEAQQKSILDQMAFPLEEVEEQPQEVQFFALLRNLVLTGYFTSEVGIKELDYRGNMPNIWDGVPQDVLDEMGLSYDPAWIAKCVDQEKRNEIAVWDEEGNLLT
ncbi:gluconate 2-dehydrogenase subunit 3 family protein [Flavobacteriaceae bacterium]|nr:gluconate 2-dehydrogenase subunit 3 family protein [Flavobacteriaceae bacterium]